jgi:hypothetical protein
VIASQIHLKITKITKILRISHKKFCEYGPMLFTVELESNEHDKNEFLIKMIDLCLEMITLVQRSSLIP